MKIISDIDQDCRSPYKVHGGYEWWYFDMLSYNGLSVVIIFYDGNPFSRRYLQAEERGEKPSPSDFPGITISICRDGKPLFYSFEEVQDRKSTRLNSSHVAISYAVSCLKKK